MKKTFLLCIGCQKGGTTWLYDYLRNHPNVNMGFEKEYHIFDALSVPECKSWLTNTAEQASRIHNVKKIPNEKDLQTLTKLGFYEDTDKYFDYFWALVNRSERIFLTGDITPSYAALSAEMFSFIEKRLDEKGFNVKVIFLMRDPVERVISAVRMQRRNIRKRDPSFDIRTTEEFDIRSAYSTRDFEIRTRYEITIKNVEKSFKEENILYCFYEELFNDEAIRQLTSFLSIPYLVPDYSKKLNVSVTQHNLEIITRKEIRHFYGATYDFIASRFGEDTIRRIWKNYEIFSKP